MDVDKVLTSFEHLATDVFPNIMDAQIHRKLIDALDCYPFPDLTPNEDWRRKQIRSALEQQIALLENGKESRDETENVQVLG